MHFRHVVPHQSCLEDLGIAREYRIQAAIHRAQEDTTLFYLKFLLLCLVLQVNRKTAQPFPLYS